MLQPIQETELPGQIARPEHMQHDPVAFAAFMRHRQAAVRHLFGKQAHCSSFNSTASGELQKVW